MDSKTDELNKYNVWLSDSNCNPIEGTDKYYWGRSARWVIHHVAYEKKCVNYHLGDLIAKLPDGSFYSCQKV